jgi:hypothetical protein
LPHNFSDSRPWKNHDESRRGSVSLYLDVESIKPQIVAWSYEPMDDPDLADTLEIPVIRNRDAIGVLNHEN